MLATALAATVAPPPDREVAVSERGRLALYRAADVAPEAGPQLRTHPLAAGPSSQQLRERALVEEDACGGLDGKAVDVIVVNPGDNTVLLKKNTQKGAKMQLKNVCGNWFAKCPCRAAETTIGRKKSCEGIELGKCPGGQAPRAATIQGPHMELDDTGFCTTKEGGLVESGVEGSLVFALGKILPHQPTKATQDFIQDAMISKAIEKKGEHKHVGEDGTFMTTVFVYKLDQEKVFRKIAGEGEKLKWYSCAEATDKTKNEHAGEIVFSGVCPGSTAFLAGLVAFLVV